MAISSFINLQERLKFNEVTNRMWAQIALHMQIEILIRITLSLSLPIKFIEIIMVSNYWNGARVSIYIERHPPHLFACARERQQWVYI